MTTKHGGATLLETPRQRLIALAESMDHPAELAELHYKALSPAERKQYDEQLRFDAAREALRARTRVCEDNYDRRIKEGATPAEARVELKGEGFWVPDTGEYVEWLEATVEQHQARADWFLVQAAGYRAKAELHLEAIEAITAAGVRNLAEIEGAS